ncbi:MAG: hypothetical protein J7639_12245 [Paenibacillaceae bacterium]|nr:hypothetical protein [Paenibacillaceae bacterium]
MFKQGLDLVREAIAAHDFKAAVARLESEMLQFNRVRPEWLNRIPDAFVWQSPLLLKAKCAEWIDRGELPQAKEGLSRAVKGIAGQAFRKQLLSALAQLAVVCQRMGQPHEAKPLLVFLRSEWDERDEEVGGDVAYALACGLHLLEAEAAYRLYYERAIAAYDRDGETVRSSAAMFELLAETYGRTEPLEWEERLAAFRLRVNARQIEEAYWHYLLALQSGRGAGPSADRTVDWDWGRSLRQPYRMLARLLEMRAALAASEEARLEQLAARAIGEGVALAADIGVQFEWALLQCEMASATKRWNDARMFLSRARAVWRTGLRQDREARLDALRHIVDRGETTASALPGQADGMAWQARLFGKMAFARNEQEIVDIRWKRKKTKELLLYLLLQPDYAASRERISEALFPESEPDKMSNQLYVCAHQLKQIMKDYMGAEAGLALKDGTVRLKEGLIELVDVERYMAMVRVGDQLWLTDRELAAGMYEKARLLYAPIAPEVEYADWLDRFREQAADRQADILRKLGGYAAERRLYDRAETYLLERIRLQPLREEAYQELLAALMAQGKKAEAGSLFKQWEQLCESEIGAGPAAETRALLRR